MHRAGLDGTLVRSACGPKPYLTTPEGLSLECGTRLAPVEVAYETWGAAERGGRQACSMCHALTGDSHAAGKYSPDDDAARLVGPADRAGAGVRHRADISWCAPTCWAAARARPAPSSVDPATGRPYGSAFPQVTVRDIVRLQYGLLRSLGVRQAGGGRSAARWAGCRCWSGW